MRRISSLLLVVATIGGVAGAQLASASSAGAAGQPQYKITFSDSCNNRSFCGDQLGGGWGTATLFVGGAGVMQMTDCGHGDGATHETVTFTWSIDTANGVFFISNASDPTQNGDTPIPAAPGHYNEHPAPGVSFEITVVEG